MNITFAVVSPALFGAHYIADYWLQTQRQADMKGTPGWAGRIACASHVTVYTITSLVALYAAASASDLQLHWPAVAAGLAVSAVTHYIADRRTPLRWLADRMGKSSEWMDNHGGLAHLDQAWHIGWLLAAALTMGIIN